MPVGRARKGFRTFGENVSFQKNGEVESSEVESGVFDGGTLRIVCVYVCGCSFVCVGVGKYLGLKPAGCAVSV